MGIDKDSVIYISGPMTSTGRSDYNYPAFHAVAEDMRECGYKFIQNPAESDGGSTDKDWGWYIRNDISTLTRCDAVVVLYGWKESKGARLEVHIAKELGLPVYYWTPTDGLEGSGFLKEADTTIKENMGQEAERIVNGPRQSTYGHPLDDYTKTCEFWTSFLKGSGKLKEDAVITPEEGTLMMVLLKISRELNKPTRDNMVDAHGYLLCYEKIVEERKRREG